VRTTVHDFDETITTPYDLGRFGDHVEFRGGVARMDPVISGSAGAVLYAVGRKGLCFENFHLQGWADPLHTHYASPFVWGREGLLFEDCQGIAFSGSVEGIPGAGLAFRRCSDVIVDGLWAQHNVRAIFGRGACANFELRRLALGSTRGIGPIEGAPPAPVTSTRGLSILYPQRHVHSAPLILAGIDGLVIDRVLHTGEGSQHFAKVSNCQRVRMTRCEGGGIQVTSDETPGFPPSEDIVLSQSVCDPDRSHNGRGRLAQFEPIQVSGTNFVNTVEVVNSTIFAPRPSSPTTPRPPAVAAHSVTATGTGNASVLVTGCRLIDRHEGQPPPVWTGGSGKVTLRDCTQERLAI